MDKFKNKCINGFDLFYIDNIDVFDLISIKEFVKLNNCIYTDKKDIIVGYYSKELWRKCILDSF